jgi:hypothetical protein
MGALPGVSSGLSPGALLAAWPAGSPVTIRPGFHGCGNPQPKHLLQKIHEKGNLQELAAITGEDRVAA